MAIREKTYVTAYVPASSIVTNATIVCILSLGFSQFVIPILAMDIIVPIHEINEIGIGNAKKTKSKTINTL